MDILPDKRIGVYQIRNTTNGKVYVGSTSAGFQQRGRRHLAELQRNTHHCGHLQQAWNKHGTEAFVFEVVEVVISPEQAVPREQAWIDFYTASRVTLYNTAPQAGSSLGYRFTDDQRAAQSALIRGHMQSQERRKVAAAAGRKAWDDPIFRARMSSPDRCKKVSESKAWRIWADLISPAGEIVSGIRNLPAFCREHSLHKSAMTLLFQGKRTQHKGWRLRYPLGVTSDEE